MHDSEVLSRFFQFLDATRDAHEFGPPAYPRNLASLPAALQPLYRRHDGLALFDGDLLIFPSAGEPDDEGTVRLASRKAREAGWHIPDEVVLFARDASDEVAGVWTGRRDEKRFPSPVIITGLIFKPAAHALLATTVERFLLTRIVWGCIGGPYARDAYEAFSVPGQFRVKDLDQLDAEAWFAWADPALPELPGDPYEDPLSGPQIGLMLLGT